MNDSNANSSARARDPDLAGAEAALHRAAHRARQRAKEAADPATLKRAAVLPNAAVGEAHDRYSFSQAQGYEEIPGPLQLGKLPNDARTAIWNTVFSSMRQVLQRVGRRYSPKQIVRLDDKWRDILRAMHTDFHNLPRDEWTAAFEPNRSMLREYFETQPFNKVFDMIQFVLRHPQCPSTFMRQMQRVFEECRLAYKIDIARPPTILPAATPAEGKAVVVALGTLRQTGLSGSAAHLRKAAERINSGDWADSVRESILAVESVARHLDPDVAKTLGPALAALEKRGALHPALKDAFSKLYGYTSDEQGVRHALLDQARARVGQDEAVFMLGACASFASYLGRKHAGKESS